MKQGPRTGAGDPAAASEGEHGAAVAGSGVLDKFDMADITDVTLALRAWRNAPPSSMGLRPSVTEPVELVLDPSSVSALVWFAAAFNVSASS